MLNKKNTICKLFIPISLAIFLYFLVFTLFDLTAVLVLLLIDISLIKVYSWRNRHKLTTRDTQTHYDETYRLLCFRLLARIPNHYEIEKNYALAVLACHPEHYIGIATPLYIKERYQGDYICREELTLSDTHFTNAEQGSFYDALIIINTMINKIFPVNVDGVD